jgi:predicted ABC-type ATPase
MPAKWDKKGGVNGASKSSIGGYLLKRYGLTWFNPDTFARELKAATGCDQETANAHAWQEGMRYFDEAVAKGLNYAFETTLGGKTTARVRARVTAGGHPIPEEKIRERYPQAQLNLIKLMPHVAYIKVYDNSVEAATDGTVPDPLLVLEMENGKVTSPAADDLKALRRAPEWARAILEAALGGGRGAAR